jgi:hypothetical protein
LHLISLSLKQAEAKPEVLRPLNIVVPADAPNQTEEWRKNMAAKIPNPKQFHSLKMTLNTIQLLNILARYFPVFHSSGLILDVVSFNNKLTALEYK